MSENPDLVAIIQQAIDQGATSAEEIHQAIASLPLDVLAQLAPLETAAEGVKEVQARTIGSVYDAIRSINEAVSNVAPAMLAGQDDS